MKLVIKHFVKSQNIINNDVMLLQPFIIGLSQALLKHTKSLKKKIEVFIVLMKY